MALQGRRELGKAVVGFSEAIRFEKSGIVALRRRARTYYELKEFSKAIADCDAALQRQPRAFMVHNERAIAYYASGDYDKAVADYDEAIQLRPIASYYYNRGVAFYAKGEDQDAIADLDRVIATSRVRIRELLVVLHEDPAVCDKIVDRKDELVETNDIMALLAALIKLRQANKNRMKSGETQDAVVLLSLLARKLLADLKIDYDWPPIWDSALVW